MATKKASQRKLSQRLSEEQYQALKDHIPDQLRQRIFNILINGLIELYESPQGEYVNAVILSKNLSVADILERGKQRDDNS